MSKLHVFYAPEMVADSGSDSPSAKKPERVVEAWKADARLSIEIHRPDPVSREAFYRAHDRRYVDGVLNREIVNGFGNAREDVARSLPWTSGAMLSAARYALAHHDAPAVCAPVSGFHHACYMMGSGFCTFNGLMVTAAALFDEGLVSRIGEEPLGHRRCVGILDCDQHYGNGTDDILKRVPMSVLGGDVFHVSIGRIARSHLVARRFLDRELPHLVERMAHLCDVVLYQAGADPHIDDPYGGWLTTDELAERDRIVFEGLRKARVPCAWNLAGGYQVAYDGSIPKVLEIHTNTALAALAACGAGGSR